MDNELSVGLVASRHRMPVSEHVYRGPIEEPNDFATLERVSKEFLHEHVIGSDLTRLVLHVTGLGQALTSFLKMWTWAVNAHPQTMPMLILAHWDRNLEDYLQQPWDFSVL
jgi:hypothetical protein